MSKYPLSLGSTGLGRGGPGAERDSLPAPEGWARSKGGAPILPLPDGSWGAPGPCTVLPPDLCVLLTAMLVFSLSVLAVELVATGREVFRLARLEHVMMLSNKQSSKE